MAHLIGLINCDAKLHGGIIGLTQNQEATTRWFLTAQKRAEMMHLTHEMCGMEEHSSVDAKHTEYGAKRMTKDEKNGQALTSPILQMTNPFLTHELSESDVMLDEYQNSLLNISTEIVADSETQSGLINTRTIGEQSAKQFTQEHLNTQTKLLFDTHHKHKLRTFGQVTTQAACKSKITLQNALSTRDMFARLLVVAGKQDIDIKALLSHELSSTPPALANQDGTMTKHANSKLLPELEKMLSRKATAEWIGPCDNTGNLPHWLIDGMAIVHMTAQNQSTAFDQLSGRLLEVCHKDLIK